MLSSGPSEARGLPKTSLLLPGNVPVVAEIRAGPCLAAVVGRDQLLLIYWDGARWHDGELVVTPIAVFWPPLPPSAEILEQAHLAPSAPS